MTRQHLCKLLESATDEQLAREIPSRCVDIVIPISGLAVAAKADRPSKKQPIDLMP